jgi:transporter
LVAVFVGWIRQKSDVLEHMREGSSVPQAVIVLWLNALRFLAPVAILLVFANTLGWI